MQEPLRNLRMTEEGHEDRRHEPRSQSGAAAVLSIAGLQPSPVRLTDVSRHGCCAEGSPAGIAPGRVVALILATGEQPLEAIVRWRRGNLAGLELLRPAPSTRQDWHALID